MYFIKDLRKLYKRLNFNEEMIRNFQTDIYPWILLYKDPVKGLGYVDGYRNYYSAKRLARERALHGRVISLVSVRYLHDLERDSWSGWHKGVLILLKDYAEVIG